MRFGEMVEEMLEERGWSQNELADRCGLSSAHINRLIRGGIKKPTLNNAFAIADALEVDVNVFRRCFVDED